MQKDRDKKAEANEQNKDLPNFTRPVWGQREMTCQECNYNGQDIDTFPCAKCHTRH